MNYEHKGMKFTMIRILFLIKFQTQRLINTSQHTVLGIGMVFIVEKQQDAAMRGIGSLDFVKNHSEESLSSLIKFNIETVLFPQTNNRINGAPLSYGEFF